MCVQPYGNSDGSDKGDYHGKWEAAINSKKKKQNIWTHYPSWDVYRPACPTQTPHGCHVLLFISHCCVIQSWYMHSHLTENAHKHKTCVISTFNNARVTAKGQVWKCGHNSLWFAGQLSWGGGVGDHPPSVSRPSAPPPLFPTSLL